MYFGLYFGGLLSLVRLVKTESEAASLNLEPVPELELKLD
jgi:hypothetical protein